MKANTTIEFSYEGVAFHATGYYLPGRPAQVSGPPEHCCPEEPPEWEFATLKAETAPDAWVDAMWALETTLADDLVDAAIEAIESESVNDWFGGYEHDER